MYNNLITAPSGIASFCGVRGQFLRGASEIAFPAYIKEQLVKNIVKIFAVPPTLTVPYLQVKIDPDEQGQMFKRGGITELY